MQFLAFPSFASSTRYEHSIGVCHLAQLAGESLKLNIPESIELMIAGLYHDVATPPFAHAIEDVLQEKFGFDHEHRLHDLITGETDDLGRERAQVFQGRSLKLFSVSQKQEAREMGLDVFRIAEMAVGRGRLGPLVKSAIDLDNIDNVVRASSAMAMSGATGRTAESIAKSYANSAEGPIFSEKAREYLETWQRLRRQLYTLIYSDIKDFGIEAMVKHAARILIEEGQFGPQDWCMTEDEFVYNRLAKNNRTAEIAERIRLGDPYSCVSMISISGLKMSVETRLLIERLGDLSREFFDVSIVPSYFVDSRSRAGKYSSSDFSLTEFGPTKEQREGSEPMIFVGLFTPDRTGKYLVKDQTGFKHVVKSTIPDFAKAQVYQGADWELRDPSIDDWISA